MSPQRVLTEANLSEYLRIVGLAPQSGEVEVSAAGEGNINWVRRARVRGRAGDGAASFVVKQARPALERFPAYRASTERLVFEARYYATVAPFDVAGVCPRVIHFDPGERVLVLEDLSDAERLDLRLARGDDGAAPARVLGAFLGAVHAGTRGPGLAERFANDEMRRLHGDHVFHLPYRPNEFPLSPALRERAEALWRDAALVERIDAAYARYLAPTGALVHADVQPTNVLLPPGRVVLLDAEIAHVGDPAFDLGVLTAHLLLPAAAARDAGRAQPAVAAAWESYSESHGPAGLCAFTDVARHTGIELLRRTLGAARVPAVAEDAAGLAVVALGTGLVRDPPERPAELSRLSRPA